MSIVELAGNYYVTTGPVVQTYVPRQSSPYRLQGVQLRKDDPSINRYVSPAFPLGIGWASMSRETGRGVGGMLDSTCWTTLGPITLAKLQETQSHAAPADHFLKALNFKSDLWGMFEKESESVTQGVHSRKFGATSDAWTGGGVISAETTNSSGRRGFDLIVHKSSMFALHNSESGSTNTNEDRYYKVSSSAAGVTWIDASGIGFPDNPVTNIYLTAAIVILNSFENDMGRLLSFGNVLLVALWRHPSSPSGDGQIEVLSSTDSGTNWASDVTIPSGDGPKAFVDWLTLAGVRSPVLVTAEGIWSVDTSANTYSLIYGLDGDVNNGRWAEVGNDGALYVGLGSGAILRLAITDSNVLETMVVGPPGDGLVTARMGHVNYILRTPSEWLLVAYGGHAASKNASVFMIDTSVILTDPITGKKFMPWHHMHQYATANLDIVALAYSTEDDGTPRLHFAVEGASASVNSHIEEPFVNPSQSTTVKYQASSVSFIRLPVDDLGDPQTNSVILQSLVDADDLSVTTAGEYIQEQYGLDGAADTTATLGNYLSGTKALSFGASAQGVAAKKIGRRLNFFRAVTNTNTPKLQESEIQAHNLLLGKRAWTFTIDIRETGLHVPPAKVAGTEIEETIIANILTATTATTLVTFTIGRMTQTRVRIPNEAPPVFNLQTVGGVATNLGYRTGTVQVRVEEGI